jgi:hypothetical protein
MNDSEELDIQCLLIEDSHCQYRVQLKKNFNYDIPTKCPYRVILKTMFEQYLADQKREQDKGEYEALC